MTIKQKRMAILSETAKHFNSENRSVHKFDNFCICRYSGKGCAIGRLIEDKTLCKEFDELAFSKVSNDSIFDNLPESLKELGRGFLIELQTLHDVEDYWGKTGLNDKGLIRYNSIRKTFCE